MNDRMNSRMMPSQTAAAASCAEAGMPCASERAIDCLDSAIFAGSIFLMAVSVLGGACASPLSVRILTAAILILGVAAVPARGRTSCVR